jgi:hypothetical protein
MIERKVPNTSDRKEETKHMFIICTKNEKKIPLKVKTADFVCHGFSGFSWDFQGFQGFLWDFWDEDEGESSKLGRVTSMFKVFIRLKQGQNMS